MPFNYYMTVQITYSKKFKWIIVSKGTSLIKYRVDYNVHGTFGSSLKCFIVEEELSVQ